jgi:hypothetical protein
MEINTKIKQFIIIGHGDWLKVEHIIIKLDIFERKRTKRGLIIHLEKRKRIKKVINQLNMYNFAVVPLKSLISLK